MSAQNGAEQGVWASSRRLLHTLLGTVQNRVELFAIEMQEEKCRLVETILCVVAVASFGLMTLTLITLTIVLLLWENSHVAALISLSVLYLAATAFAWRALQARLNKRTPFSTTVEELRKDRSCLEMDD